MKKLILGIFTALTIGVSACELDDMTNYFQSEKLVYVSENTLYINNIAWWRKMSVTQKEKLGNIFRQKSINHKEKIFVSQVRDMYTGELLAEFKAWDNEIKVVKK